MQKLLKISQQTIWQSVVKLITTTSGFIILSTVARNYGEDGTGSFTLALTYLAFFYILADFGFNALVVSKLQEKDSSLEWRKLLGTRIVWSGLLSCLALILVSFLPFNPPSLGFSPDFKLAVLFGSLTIVFFAVNVTASNLFQSKLRYDLGIIPTLIGVSIGTLTIILLANFKMPVYTLTLGYLVAWFFNALGTYLFVGKLIKNPVPLFDFKYIKILLKEVLPIASTLVLNVIYFRVDSFILAASFSQSTVGVYNMAYQFFQAVLVLPTFIMNAFYPMILDTLKNEHSSSLNEHSSSLNEHSSSLNGSVNFTRQIRLASIGLLFFSLILVVVVYYLSPFVIRLISGTGFLGSVYSLQILSLGFPAYFLSALFMWVMVAKKMYKPMVSIYLIGLMFNLIANLIYIPQYSYIEASWITGLSEYLILFLQVMVLWLNKR